MQFFNSPCGGHSSEALTSTPVCDIAGGLITPSTDQKTPQRVRTVFQTPTVSQIATSQLHTPTPFKRALAELERKSGIVHVEVCMIEKNLLPDSIGMIYNLSFFL